MQKIQCVYGWALIIYLLTAFASRAAHADDNVITLAPINIVGRVQKPIASVGVAKIPPKLTLTELKQSFLQQIEDALYVRPF